MYQKDITLEVFFFSSEYLEAHQAELDYLSGRHKDTKRNSRLVCCS